MALFRLPLPRAKLACAVAVAVLASSAAGLAQSDDALRGRTIAAGGGPGGVGAACMTCHGPQGGGEIASGFPRLAGLEAAYLAKQLNDYANGTRPNEIMTPIALQLSDADRIAVARHYAELTPHLSAVETLGAIDAGKAQRGGALYAQGSQSLGVQACVNCHGPGGKGMNVTYPAIAGQPAAYTQAQLSAWKAGVRTNDIAQSMATIATRLSDDDMAALAHFLERLAP